MKWLDVDVWVPSGESTAVQPLAGPQSIIMVVQSKRKIIWLHCCEESRGTACVLLSQRVCPLAENQPSSPSGLANQTLLVGSDVAGLTTIATKSADGKSYVINGEKKWVTQGRWADVALVAARTGPPTAKGISVFIVPLNSKGISRRKMKNSGVSSSGKNTRYPRIYEFSADRFLLLRFHIHGIGRGCCSSGEHARKRKPRVRNHHVKYDSPGFK